MFKSLLVLSHLAISFAWVGGTGELGSMRPKFTHRMIGIWTKNTGFEEGRQEEDKYCVDSEMRLMRMIRKSGGGDISGGLLNRETRKRGANLYNVLLLSITENELKLINQRLDSVF